MLGVYAGLRPLLTGESDSTSKLSREHTVEINAPGMATVAGGKYTTYRPMAADAVDKVSALIPGKTAESRTKDVLLVGAERYGEVSGRAGELATQAGVPLKAIDHLIRRYGSIAEEIVAAIAADPRLGEPIPGAPAYLKAEIWYAAAAGGRSASRRCADPPHPHLDRGARPWARGGGAHRGDHGRGARLG